MKLPKRDIIPACYDLTLEGTTLLFHVHPRGAEVLKQVLNGPVPLVSVLREELSLPKFIPPTEEQWGFGKILTCRQSALSGWILYQCPLPVVLGPQIGDEANWQEAFAVSATLQVLFRALVLEVLEGERDSLLPQLLFIDGMVARGGMHGGSLHATLCPPLCTWLSQQEDNSECPEIVEAMKRVFEHMSGREESEFRAWLRQPKWINLSCPGDACGLDPDGYNDLSLERGYTLSPHNVDTPIQQFTLLSGLAVLCQLARGS